MTIEEQKELAKKLVREHVFTSTDWETGDLDERLFKAMSVYAEAAKLEERKRIEEALPQMRICDRAEHYDHILEQENFDGFNECLDKVRSIITPQIQPSTLNTTKKAEDLEKELGIKRESDGPLTQEKWMSPIQEYAKIDPLFHRDHGTKAIKNM